ncbi:DUF1700 domain-containing protein [Paenibacillus assamensis]|uniref:DUF1700 domain-containing protein n=1 Tax=Paenibacillus assamensis TaxID=311244 RepID=UPI00048F0A1A|nr:DUF1700 domain-containing protein [Paenibacillus assamensis]
MNKQKYISELSSYLKCLPPSEREVVLGDYEEHFANALYCSRDEEEIVRSLGTPKLVAKEIIAQYRLQEATHSPTLNRITKATLAIAGIGIFNIVPVLIPFAISLLVVVSMYVIAGLLLASPLIMLIQNGVSWNLLFDFFWILGLVGVGLLLVIGLNKMITWYYNQVLRYLRYSIRKWGRNI